MGDIDFPQLVQPFHSVCWAMETLAKAVAPFDFFMMFVIAILPPQDPKTDNFLSGVILITSEVTKLWVDRDFLLLPIINLPHSASSLHILFF